MWSLSERGCGVDGPHWSGWFIWFETLRTQTQKKVEVTVETQLSAQGDLLSGDTTVRLWGLFCCQGWWLMMFLKINDSITCYVWRNHRCLGVDPYRFVMFNVSSRRPDPSVAHNWPVCQFFVININFHSILCCPDNNSLFVVALYNLKIS